MLQSTFQYSAVDISCTECRLCSYKCCLECKVIEELTRRLQKCDDMREHHLHEIHSLRGCFNVVNFYFGLLRSSRSYWTE